MGRGVKTYIFLISLGFVLFTFLQTAETAVFDPKQKYETIQTEHFSIHFSKNIEETAREVAVICEETYQTLSPKYNWRPFFRTQVILTDSADEADGMASVIPYNWVYLRVAAPPATSSMAVYKDWLRLLIMHEYTHIMQIDKHGGFWTPFRYILGKTAAPNGLVPRWIKEGFTVYEETVNTEGGRGRSSFGEMMVRTSVLEDKFPAIDEADGDQWKWPDGFPPYIWGGKFIKYLADKYGEDKIYEFVERTGESPLILEINRQARQSFSKMEFDTKKIHNRYVKEKKIGAPRSKTFYALWKDWHQYLKELYKPLREKIEKEGLTPFEVVLKSRQTIAAPIISPDGKKVVYSEETPFRPPLFKISDIDGGNPKIIKKDILVSQASFLKDGSSIFFSRPSKYKRYQYVYDIFRYDIETKKFKRLTSGKRARDPDVSPDGKNLVCTTQDQGSMALNLLDLEKKELTELPTDAPTHTQFSNPRFSPDGKRIAVAVSLPGHIWDVYIYTEKGKLVTHVTNDDAVDRDPFWSPDGNWLYFASDRTGISNIYRYNLRTKKTEKVTNVLTGAFSPRVTADGETLYVQYYNGEGFDIRKTSLKRGTPVDVKNVDDSWLKKDFSKPWHLGDAVRISRLPMAETEAVAGLQQYKVKKYSPFTGSLFMPKSLMPTFMTTDDGVLIGGMVGGADPLRWHSWMGGVNYRTDASYLGYFFNYDYARFRPIFEAGMMNYIVNFGTFTNNVENRRFHYYEKRIQGYGGVSFPFGRQAVGVRYFYEDRESRTALTQLEKNALSKGDFAGFRFFYGYNDSKAYAASVSREGGPVAKLSFTTTNSIFGSGEGNEQYIFAGDVREFIRTFGRQVLALKVAGGMTWGDQPLQGTFTLGGDLGEGLLAGGGSLYYFPLRGLPVATLARTRSLLFSGEYRFPLVDLQRGIGTMPFFIKAAHVGLFADYGNAWDADESPGKYFFGDFFLGTGVELRGDFVVGYGLPINGRLGYGIIVVNRDRLKARNLRDAVLGNPASKGMFILQFGTSF